MSHRLDCPFGLLETLTSSEIRDTAYELFFMACRSSAGSSSAGRSSNLGYHPALGLAEAGGVGESVGSPRGGTGLTVAHSRIKKALGLKRRSVQLRTSSGGPNSPVKVRRPMTSAEIMRLQMRVTDQSDSRLRKALVRTLVGQVGRRAETIILPLELLRQLKPSEFNNAQDYHQWQRRQLKVLEAGLLLFPSLSLDKSNNAAAHLRELINSSEHKAIDTRENSESMRLLCESVLALAWRTTNGSSPEVCHWADGYPLNILIYLSLLQPIFDLKDETVVLDEVDELVELMKKTWSSLGINRMIHNVCFSWVLFQRYVETKQIEPDLLCATTAMLVEIANDATKTDRDPYYVKTLSSAVTTMQSWAEEMLLDYHESFQNDAITNMDNVIALGLVTWKIVTEDLQRNDMSLVELESEVTETPETRVSYYIRTSVRNALTKLLENGPSHEDSITGETIDDPSELLVNLAKDAEVLALMEREKFSSILKKWHPNPTATAAVAIHNCFGMLLRQYLSKATMLTAELVKVLHAAGKLEKVLVQIIVEDTSECDDGGESVARDMIPYDVETIVMTLLKAWIDERLSLGKECLMRAKETESWMPMSKTEPYAQSAVDIMKLAKVTVDEFFEIPVGARDEMVHELVNGLEILIQEYTSFVASCGTKQSYIPALPPLTRCNQNSKFIKLWKKAAIHCDSGADLSAANENPHPSTSRGTQRLYIRLNTLHYILTHLHALDKSLSFFTRSSTTTTTTATNSGLFSTVDCLLGPSHHFSNARTSIHAAIHYVAEVAAYRLIFLDSRTSFYDELYTFNVMNSRICPALRTLKQNLTLLVGILVDKAQPLAVKEVMKASFEVFLMVLLAGGSRRAFTKADHEMIVKDFDSLKRVFCTPGEGLVAEEVVEREAEVVQGILELMGMNTERIIEEFGIVACESSGCIGRGGVGEAGVVPATTGKWNRAEPNTVLRVLCYRDDALASEFLKTTFQLPKRK